MMFFGSDKKENGFTLVELLVALAIGLILLGGIYSVYRSQQKSFVLQEQVASMHQNIRSAMYFMSREIRMCGCDPTGKANAGIVSAGNDSIHFTRDIHGSEDNRADGVIDAAKNEVITYAFGANDQITRNAQAIAVNIDALDFVYLDQNGAPLNPGLGDVAENDLTKIISVQITVVARTEKVDQGYRNQDSFKNQQGVTILAPQNDSFHRKLLTSNIRCRNF